MLDKFSKVFQDFMESRQEKVAVCLLKDQPEVEELTSKISELTEQTQTAIENIKREANAKADNLWGQVKEVVKEYNLDPMDDMIGMTFEDGVLYKFVTKDEKQGEESE